MRNYEKLRKELTEALSEYVFSGTVIENGLIGSFVYKDDEATFELYTDDKDMAVQVDSFDDEVYVRLPLNIDATHLAIFMVGFMAYTS